MDIQNFITFREVARCLNLTRAAERLGYAQPTITVQIQNMEKHFKAKLFERTGKTLKLTSDGVKLLQHADKIVEVYLRAEESFLGAQKVNLQIGTTESLAAFFLPPYFQALRHKYPAVNLTIKPLTQGEIAQKLKNGELDLGIAIDTRISDSELQTMIIKKDELIIICPENHPLQGKKEITLQELQNCDLILTEKTCTYRGALERSLKNDNIPFQIISELGNIEAIKQCVIFGMGAALLPKITVMDEINKGSLYEVSIQEGSLPQFYTQVLVHKNRHVNEPLNYLISLLNGSRSQENILEPA